jgi:uncharacterized protein (DUF2147 family)
MPALLASRKLCRAPAIGARYPPTPAIVPIACKIDVLHGLNMKLYRLCSVSAVALSAFFIAGTAHADPKGLWLAQDGAIVRVSSCGRTLCATIAAAKSRVDPATGQPWTDKNNPDPGSRNRPLVGVEVLSSMMPDGPGRWSGTLYNTDNGQTYQGHLLEMDRRTIRVEACVIGICGGQNMSRIQ